MCNMQSKEPTNESQQSLFRNVEKLFPVQDLLGVLLDESNCSLLNDTYQLDSTRKHAKREIKSLTRYDMVDRTFSP